LRVFYFLSCLGVITSIVIFIGCGSPAIKQAANAHSQFELAKKEYDKKHYLTAVQGFQRVVFNFPGATIVDTAQYYLAMSYYENEEYELAAVEFNRLLANYPHSAYADDAQFMSGVCYYQSTPRHYGLDQGELEKAIKALEDFITDNPDSPRIEDARKVIGQARNRLARKDYENGYLYFKIASYDAAKVYFQLVVDDYTDTEYAPKALFRLGEILYKQDKFVEASEKLNSFLSIYPSDKMAPQARAIIEKISHKTDSANVSAPTL
jgi:outer membrane protein assembly factor BamD